MTAPTLWWLACGAAVVLELATGSLYLLMIGCGLAAGAVAAYLGASTTVQLLVAAAVGGVGTIGWHRRRSRRTPNAASPENPDVNQDIGAAIQVAGWDADRRARVAYRGTHWTARLRSDLAPEPGLHRVVAVEGNWLVLEPAAPPPSF